ncbi:pyrroline-5-carboxylate reductase [Candidatus Vallotia tarda]|uniref:Pyrroline-5-carboxylate reductase n=1 Tax=Candidatus Vallotiella hemipterorum TaxID=1177213 RepID=A0A916JSM5_9BURK|nr:pyrroline-5-carboxylate reductase [Candidatus Vallotia tarda]CAG7599979.1 Pyrroline-5-carboxylate reductase [Candidatus Vallotia tarda]
MKIIFIGAGNIASALIGGLLRQGISSDDLHAIDPSAGARKRLNKRYPIETSKAASSIVENYDALILAVKPQVMKKAIEPLAPWLSTQLIISVAAGIRLADISRWLNGYSHVVRAMPNIPALVGVGATGLVSLHSADDADQALAERVLRVVGEIIWCEDESQIDAVTAISGSGPAYVFYFIEAMRNAACELGLNDKQARALVLSTFSGAIQLAAQSDEFSGILLERVVSEGGTTAAALQSFEADNINKAISRGVSAAYTRAIQIGVTFGKQ